MVFQMQWQDSLAANNNSQEAVADKSKLTEVE